MKLYRVVIKSAQHEDVSFCFDDINDAAFAYKKFFADLQENAINRQGDSIKFQTYDAELISTEMEIIR